MREGKMVNGLTKEDPINLISFSLKSNNLMESVAGMKFDKYESSEIVS